MLNMQLPEREQENLHGPHAGPLETSGEPGFPILTKEAVYEWFGLRLNPSRRLEFVFGLLHMCQPLELRFLGSCLEDLARKDFHVLRDFELRANSPSDLGHLTDVSDPVTRSKLLVCLSLLGSENRECAGVLFRILGHVDSALLLSSCPDPPVHSQSGGSGGEGRGFVPFVESRAALLEQLAVLYTMASLHPAFLFHQRDRLRTQLETLQQNLLPIQNSPAEPAEPLDTPARSKPQKPECLFTNSEVCVNEKSHDLTPAHHRGRAERDGKAHAVHIEKIVLKGISWGKTGREYNFEVKWSDLSISSVTKTHLELENFLLKLPKEHSTDTFERGILRLLNQGPKPEAVEVEQSLKEKFLAAPHAFRHTGNVCVFFHCGSSQSSSLSCSRCNYTSSGNPCKEDCSETSSQEEDMELYVQGHRKKPGNKNPGLNVWGAQCKRTDQGLDNNRLNEWKKKSCAVKPTSSQNVKSGDGGEESSGCKPKARESHSNSSEKGGRGAGRVPYITNGVMSPPSPLAHNSKGNTTGPNTYGETSSESYSSPSSPQHDGRESLDSEDEKGKDDSRKSVADPVCVCPASEGPTDALHPLIPLEQGGQEVHPEGPLRTTGVEFPQLRFGHHAPYPVHNGPVVLQTGSSPQLPDTKVGTELPMPHPVVIPAPSVAIHDPEKCSSEAVQSFSTSVLGLQAPGSPVLQPILQQFKTAGLQSNPETGVLVPPALKSPMGAISVVQSGTTFPSALQAGYASADQLLSSVTPGESHTKPQGLTLPSALTPSFNLPAPTTGMPPMGTVGSSNQVPAPVVPTHASGPAPSPIPALTHSTAQSDCNSYINSSVSNSAPQLQQQVLGCNACGCRGSCGSSHTPNYYFPTQVTPRHVFNMPPVFQLTSLCSSSYLSQLSQTPQNNGASQVPFYPAAPGAFAGGTLLHPHSHTHSDHVLGSQAASFGLQQMTAFNRFYQPMYATMIPGTGSGPAMALGTVSGGINKKNGSISCYNCGGSGHYAQDCKQSPVDATQQGGFRLKYSSHSEALDNNPD